MKTCERCDQVGCSFSCMKTQRDEALARADKLSHACDTHDNRAHKFETENAALRVELARKTEALERMATKLDRCTDECSAAKDVRFMIIAALADSPKAGGEPVCSRCGLSPYDPKWKSVVCQHTAGMAPKAGGPKASEVDAADGKPLTNRQGRAASPGDQRALLDLSPGGGSEEPGTSPREPDPFEAKTWLLEHQDDSIDEAAAALNELRREVHNAALEECAKVIDADCYKPADIVRAIKKLAR